MVFPLYQIGYTNYLAKTNVMNKVISILMLACTIVACNTTANKEAAILQAKKAVVDSMTAVNNAVVEKQRIIDSVRTIVDAPALMNEKTVVTHTTTTTEVAPKKKGLNGVATGALVGAGVGAITGAMVDGKKGEGAIVGGLIGAAAGAGTGAIIDAKKKKKAQQKK